MSESPPSGAAAEPGATSGLPVTAAEAGTGAPPLPPRQPSDPADQPDPQPALRPVPAPSLPRLFAAFALDVLLAGVMLLLLSIALAMPFLAAELMALPAGAGGAADMDAATAAAMPQLTAAAIVAMLLVAVALWLLRGRQISGGPPPMRAAPAYTLAVFAGVGIQALCLGIAMLAGALGVPIDPSNAEPINELNRRWPWLAWTTVVIMAPLAEELLFRHVLLRRFAAAGRGVLGIVATSLLFAAMHELVPGEQGWSSWLTTTSLYVAMGVGFGAVYLRSGRLGAAFVAHATCNLTAMGLLAFSGS